MIVTPDPHGRQPVKQKILDVMNVLLVKSLVNRALSTYPRHRWVGADLAFDEVGILFAVSGIGYHSFFKLMYRSALPEASSQARYIKFVCRSPPMGRSHLSSRTNTQASLPMGTRLTS